MKLLGENYINPRVRKQLNQYVEEYNYTYSGMLKALIYFYEVKGNSVEKANGGIGIIPWIYKDAYNYYYNLWMIKQRNEDKNILSPLHTADFDIDEDCLEIGVMLHVLNTLSFAKL